MIIYVVQSASVVSRTGRFLSICTDRERDSHEYGRLETIGKITQINLNIRTARYEGAV